MAEGKTIAKAKCCFCGVDAFIAEGMPTVGRHNQMVMHAEPFCEKFLAADPDEFIKRCDFKAVDEPREAITDALRGLLK